MWSFLLLLFCREEKRCFTSTAWLKVVSVCLEKPIISIYIYICTPHSLVTKKTKSPVRN